MSRHPIAHRGGDKPALAPLPVDPIQFARNVRTSAAVKAVVATRKPPTTASEGDCDTVMDLLSQREASPAEICTHLACDISRARYILRRLEADGLIEHSGSSNRSRWRVRAMQRFG